MERIILLSFVIALVASTSSRLLLGSDDLFFENRIRPLIQTHCLECHSGDTPEGKLDLSSRDAILNGGDSGPAAIPGNGAESLLIVAVKRTGTLQMPPEKELSSEEIEALSNWVDEGMKWPESLPKLLRAKGEFKVTEQDREHWAFRQVAIPSQPTVHDTEWIRSPMDTFVLAELEGKGIKPLPQADRRTLVRRLYFDLIGLPPSWEQVEKFVNDPRDTQTVMHEAIDELLRSPRYGERWGRYWLDIARYADTKDGVLMYGDDRIRPYAYTYRDYVIRAFNEDTPFDQFVREQLAADQITPPVEPWRMGAMGFLTLGRMFDNNIHDVIDDQIDTMTRGFLGLTASCARCHDHKYDPISMADYYGMYGVFASSEIPLELPLTNSNETSAETTAFEKTLAEKREGVRIFRDEQFNLLTATARDRVGDYLVHVATTKPDPLETSIFFLSLAPEELRPPIVARWRRKLDLPEMADDPVFGPWHFLLSKGSPADPITPEQLSAMHEFVRTKVAGTQPSELNPLVKEVLLDSNPSSRQEFAKLYADLFKRIYEEAGKPTSLESITDLPNKQLLHWIIGSESPLYFPKSQTRKYMSRADTDKFGGLLQELDRMPVQSPHAAPRGMVMYDSEAKMEPRIFVRGNPTQLGKQVPRQFLEVLSTGDRKPFATGSGRLDLANAIANRDNPLTARVYVNRIWMYHFGEPLVASPSDFGKRTTPPENLALLDFLAADFMENNWSTKHLHRQILRSATWQQSSQTVVVAGNAESANSISPPILRYQRTRLSFEAMRDSLLALSGRLEQRESGRPVDITDPNSKCRTIYGLVDRQNLPGMFRSFDFASPDQSIEKRPRTMVAQQALFALNSPFMIEQAKSLASAVEAANSTPNDQVTWLFQRIYSRNPSESENSECITFLNSEKQADTQLSNLQMLCQILLSSNELMYVD